MRHTGCSAFFYLAQSRTCKRFLFLYVSLSTTPANTRLFACSRTRTHIIAYQHTSKRRKSFFFFARREEGKKIRRERKSNSVADWSRVTVHIKSNYKCSLVSSSIFSLSVSNSLCFSLLLLFLFLSRFFLLCIEKERKRESAKR
jgi:hypothetical protein